MIAEAMGLPGDYHEAADSMRDQVKRAAKREQGTRLTPDQVQAFNLLMSDSDWWNVNERKC